MCFVRGLFVNRFYEIKMVLANREQNSDTMAINNTGKTQPRARAVQGVGEQISRYAAHAIAGVTRVKLASKTEPASSKTRTTVLSKKTRTSAPCGGKGSRG